MEGKLKKVNLDNAERLLYPRIPALVTSRLKDRIGGMLASWWTQLSFKPFLVGVAIAPERFTYKLISDSKVYSLNFIDFSYVERTPFLGDVSGRFYPRKLEAAGFTIVNGEVLGAPIVAEASAALEVLLVKVVEAGDHNLFIGEVKAAYAIEGFHDIWDLRYYKPLMYLGRIRRPSSARRVYITCRDYDIRELEPPEPLKEYSIRRLKLLEDIEKAVKNLLLESEDEKIKVIARILESYGLDPGDAKYYLEEVKKRVY